MKILGIDTTKFFNVSKEAPKKADIIQQIVRSQTLRTRNNMDKWRSALNMAESDVSPMRRSLIEIYTEVTVDNHLQSQLNSIYNSILKKPFKIVDKSGNKSDEKTKLFNESWFYNYLQYALESRFWGFSLIQFGDIVNDKFTDVCLVPRVNVHPEYGKFTKETYLTGDSGISYTDKPYKDWVMFIGNVKDMGILHKCAPMVFYKKWAMGAWSEFIEIFGIPPRVGHTDIRDETMKKNMELMLKNMSNAAWAVMGEDDRIEFLETARTDAYMIYDNMIERCNSEMSKILLGQTMTSDNGSSKSQAEVHDSTKDDFIGSYCRWLQFQVNDQLLPFMLNLGFELNGYKFEFDEKEDLDLTQLSTFVLGLLQKGDVDEKYIEEKFGVPFKKSVEQGGGAAGKKLKAESQSIINRVNALYEFCGCGDHSVVNELNEMSAEEADKYLYDIYYGYITLTSLPNDRYQSIARSLFEEFEKGYGITLDEAYFGSIDDILLERVKDNIYTFSAARTFQEVRYIKSLMYDSNGNIISFEDFKAKAAGTLKSFNVHYLKTEYDIVRRSAEMVKLWKKIEAEQKEFPLLKYVTKNDSRVRPSHAVLEGIVKPVNDVFWDSYYPPNGWHCRCTVSQLRKSDYPSNEIVNKIDYDLINKDVPEYFRFNPYKKKYVFSPKHPYFKDVPEEWKEWAKQNFGLPL